MWGIEEVPNIIIVPIRLPEEDQFGNLKSLARINRNSKLEKACKVLQNTLSYVHVFPKAGETHELVELWAPSSNPAMLVKNGRIFTLPTIEMPKDSSMYEKLIEFLKS